jgi:iron(III) transport system permease protein
MRAAAIAAVPRSLTILVTAAAVLAPLVLILYQSFLTAPFFDPRKSVGIGAYEFIFADPDFWQASLNSVVIATAMVTIAVPLGGILAFVMERTDLPGKRWIEPLILVPSFVSPMVLAFGFVVAAGPVGFYTVWATEWLGGAPWGIYSLTAIGIIAGLLHVPNVYVYASAALKSLGSDVEEAARVAGASPFRVAATVSLPLIMPAMLFAAVLVFFLGFELFGLPLVLGDPEGHLVLSTYLYKLTNKLGTPSYHLMAAVAICIVAVTFPLVLLQRYLLQNARKYATIKGKAGRMRELPLGKWKWVAAGLIGLWLFVGVIVPLSGIALRAFVTNWGYGAKLAEVLTLDHFQSVFDEPILVRAIWNRRRRHRRRVLLRDRLCHAPPQRWLVALRRLSGAGTPRRSGIAGRPGIPLGLPFLPAAAAAAHDDIQHVARLYRRVARVRHAAHLVVADAGFDGTGRGRAHRGRQPRPDYAPDHAAADSPRTDRIVAARVHDLRA